MENQMSALPELLERVKRLEVELAFYADRLNYVGYADPRAGVYLETSAVEADGGKRARAALSAIAANGVRLVPAQLIDGDERTTVRIFTPYAPTSPYAPQKEQTHESE